VWPDGTVRWIADRGRATFDAQGQPLQMDGVTIDFTGRKRLEEELHDLTRDLRDADRRKDQFLAVLGHELRNPLAPLRNALAILRMNGTDATTRERSLAVMERQMAQVTSLVDELLDVSRIAQGKLRLEKQEVRLSELVEQAAESAEPLVAKRRHRLRVVAAQGDTWLVVDRARIGQVLANLLNNAAKYTEEGGDIELRAEIAGGVAVLAVKDNGIGIPHEAQARIFEPFSQVEGALDRSAGGLGLGLNVARRLVEMHGGTIGVHSDGPGAGSTFTVTLPVRLTIMGSDPISSKLGSDPVSPADPVSPP
jgi:signal transduction histidine kinase